MTITLAEESTASGSILRVGGVVDLRTAETLTDRVVPLTQRLGATVVLDLADVTFLDSTGLSALVSCQLACTQAGSRLVVAGPSGNVRALLRITGLDQVLQVSDAAHR